MWSSNGQVLVEHAKRVGLGESVPSMNPRSSPTDDDPSRAKPMILPVVLTMTAMLTDEALKLSDDPLVLAQRQLRLDPILHRYRPQLFQTDRLEAERRPPSQVAIRIPIPQRHGRLKSRE